MGISQALRHVTPSVPPYSEEQDDGNGGGVYVVPGAGALVYCGFQGIMSMFSGVRDNNDLGHPICDNLRAGDWLMGYTVNRLRLRDGTGPVSGWVGGGSINLSHRVYYVLPLSSLQLADILSLLFSQVSILPRYLIPCYFEAVVTATHAQLTRAAITQMGT